MSQLLHNAAAGTALILAVALLRRTLKDRLIPEVRLVLWAACLFRLLTPFAPESVLSLWGLFRRAADAAPAQSAPGPAVSTTHIPGPAALPSAAQTVPALSVKTVLAFLWLAVGLALAVRYVLLWRRTRRAVGCTTPVEGGDPRYAPLPRCARLREGAMDGAPLTFGAARPTVVLPPNLEGAALDCVLAHEGVHARRRDNLWHYAMALALAAFWWDPAVWLMARLLRRDVELSCDRAALRRLGPERRKDYALALVSLSTQAGGPAFCHTFGRKAAEERILSIMKFKKTSISSLSLSLLLVFGITAAFASDPVESPGEPADQPAAALETPAPGQDLPNEVPEAGFYYKDEDGKLVPIDPDTVSTAVTVTVNDDGEVTVDDGSGPVELPEGSSIWVEGKDGEVLPFSDEDYIPVNPADVDLSMLKEYLAKKVADGELTQAEADEMLANVQEMLEQAQNGDVSLWISVDSSGDADSFCVSSYSFGGEDISNDTLGI